MSALKRIQKLFPQVQKVHDARRSILVSVTKHDSSSARKKDPGGCALAKACVRQKLADAAIIGVGISWLIKGRSAMRYKTSTGVAREITSFDRHQDFAEGQDYVLSKVPPTGRLDFPRNKGGRKTGPHNTSFGKPVAIHKHETTNIRVVKKGA